jgi:hypothetical protein
VSAPQILSISPLNSATDVILGTAITVTFDAAIDPSSITTGSFICFGPGQTGLISPEQLISQDPTIVTGREYIKGTFTFPSANQFIFTPSMPLRPNAQYTVLLAGSGTVVVTDTIKGADGTPLVNSFQSIFTTGVVNSTIVPPSSPLAWNDPLVAPWNVPKIDPNTIQVQPIEVEGNDLSQQIVLTFPANIDPSTFNLSDVAVLVEPISNDPLIPKPAGLNYSVSIQGNQLIISVGNWPTPPPPPLPLPLPPCEDRPFGEFGCLDGTTIL